MAEQPYTVGSDSEISREEKPSTSPETAIGIDIGTSQCSVAVWNGSEVELLNNTHNQKIMKSYVSFKDDIPTSGATITHPAHEHEILSGSTVFNIKRLIGGVDTDPIVHTSTNLPFLVQTLNIGVRPLIASLVNNVWRSTTPEEVMAIFLLELRTMAEKQLKRPIRNVVITIPVSFSRFQLTRIERACAMAGLHVLRLMPEPSAVALLYAQQKLQNVGDNMDEMVVLIFNMGGGYCDVAVSATAGGVSQVKALIGIPVGGEDILLNMMRYLVPEFDTIFSGHGLNDIKSMASLRMATQNAIHMLSTQSNVNIQADLGNGRIISKLININEFEEINKNIFQQVETIVSQCLHDAKVKHGGLNDVILVGGCSLVPKIRDILKRTCMTDALYEGIDPFEAPVRGAALEGAVASGITDPFGSLDLLTIQAAPLSIGIKADGGSFIPIIRRNMTVPLRKDLVFTTVHDNQTQALIVVYEGEEIEIEKNHLLGYFMVTGIPPLLKGLPEIKVCMDIDASNVLRVLVGVVIPGRVQPVSPIMEVRMPMVDDGHGWCGEALNRTYGSSLDLITVQKKGHV